MLQTSNILQIAHLNTVDTALNLLHMREQHIPGSVHYVIRRYYAQQACKIEDGGMMVYNYSKSNKDDNFLELRFCTIGNKYCFEKDCAICLQKPSQSCDGAQETIDVFSFYFSSSFLNQFVQNIKLSNKKDEVLAFKHTQSFTKIFPLCNRKRYVLDTLLTHSYSGAIENIFVNSKVHEVLLYSLECLVEETEGQEFSCKFLTDEAARDRIFQARDILLQHIGEPLTIKELSRKVAMNECYLKKGFKAFFGTTIFDFYQQQRMEHAKYLLYEKGLSVTDISVLLGYSSISHFSSAFKKHTGLKPCDLLK